MSRRIILSSDEENSDAPMPEVEVKVKEEPVKEDTVLKQEDIKQEDINVKEEVQGMNFQIVIFI